MGGKEDPTGEGEGGRGKICGGSFKVVRSWRGSSEVKEAEGFGYRRRTTERGHVVLNGHQRVPLISLDERCFFNEKFPIFLKYFAEQHQQYYHLRPATK